MNMIKQYINLYKNPLRFFKWDAETNYVRLITFFLAPVLILFLSEILFSIITQGNLNLERVLFILIFLIGSVIISLTILFLYSAVTHLGVLFVKKKALFLNSFKAAIFGFVTLIPYLFLLMIISFFSLYFFSQQNSIYAALSLIVPVVGYSHALIIQILAIFYYHRIGVLKSFLSVVIPLLLLLLITVGVVFISLIMSYQPV